MLIKEKLPDLLSSNLDIVFAGTAAGTKSATIKAYYAGNGNKFNETIHNIGLTPRQLKPEEYKELKNYGIGLTDVAKYASGLDIMLSKNDYDVGAFRKKIEEYQPKVLAFNGKRAAKVFLNMKKIEYGRQTQTIGNTLIYVLPSTSGLASRWWDDTFWEDLAKELPARYPHA